MKWLIEPGDLLIVNRYYEETLGVTYWYGPGLGLVTYVSIPEERRKGKFRRLYAIDWYINPCRVSLKLVKINDKSFQQQLDNNVIEVIKCIR